MENAIKHGILKKLNGGTVIIKTFETDNNYVVEIKDDGVGFNSDGIDFNGNEHLGLKNIYYRIKNCGGNMTVNSDLDKGTSVVVTFSKQSI